MSVTISMWLGIAFLVLAVVAVLLQAWLWGPKFWNEEEKKTHAPKAWLRVHAASGYLFGIIYVVMMWNMFPRLWEYQYELPARTVIHAVVAIILGVLLITKIMILLFFRHFEESMPQFGFGILVCTVVLTTLSVPHAVRGLDLQGRIGDAENMARVEQILAEIDFGEGSPQVAELTSEEGLRIGRDILVNKCITCHDMRTILMQPRTGARWHELVLRMQEKPDPFNTNPLTDAEVPFVTAYLVAITPDIQASRKKKVEEEKARDEVEQKTVAAMAEEADTSAPSVEVDETKAKAILGNRCTDCHENEEIENFGGADVAGWAKVITSMVEEGAEITDEEAVVLTAWLAQAYPKK